MTDRPQKITFAEMRESGVRGVLRRSFADDVDWQRLRYGIKQALKLGGRYSEVACCFSSSPPG